MREAALEMQASGHRLIACVGEDLPFERLIEAGFAPLLLSPGAETSVDFADNGLGQILSWRSRAILRLIGEVSDRVEGVLLSHSDASSPHVFAALREMPQLKRNAGNTFFLDMLNADSQAAVVYNDKRMVQFERWLADLSQGVEVVRRPLHAKPTPAVAETGTRKRILLTGGREDMPAVRRALEAGSAVILGEVSIAGSFEGIASYEGRLSRAIDASEPNGILHVHLVGDEAAAWTASSARQLAIERGIAFFQIAVPPGPLAQDIAVALQTFGNSLVVIPRKIRHAPNAVVVNNSKPAESGRSRKALASTAHFGQYQRDWFANLKARVEAGGPFAIVNANAPQEILRAFDVPFVVNQWWASIVAAKRQSARYAGLLRENGFPDTVEAYSAQGLAALFDTDPQLAPWGGLPKPTQLHAVPESDATRNLFEVWARAAEAKLYLYQRSIDSRWQLPERWWEILPDQWDLVLEPERLDLMTADLWDSVRRLENETGQRFDRERFIEVMDLVNEQEQYYRLTRDLIAASRPAPVSIVDTMPATMVPQWHRGTPWARDAAKAFYEEVRERVKTAQAACPNERLRLMWVGRGLWGDTAFYQKWEESHGAVFVWSMYLGLAADGYIRSFDHGRDPIHALAARFLTMGDELRMPTWASAWHLKEAQTNGIDGVIAIDDADPFVLRALEGAGFPVLKLPVSNQETVRSQVIESLVTRFLDRLGRSDPTSTRP